MDGREDRAAVTRRRHGDDFYARIGRRSRELRRRAREGDPAALEALRRRRAARDRRAAAWREELASRALANAEPARAILNDCFTYTRRLRAELAQAEGRPAASEAAHRRLLRDLGPVDADDGGAG